MAASAEFNFSRAEKRLEMRVAKPWEYVFSRLERLTKDLC